MGCPSPLKNATHIASYGIGRIDIINHEHHSHTESFYGADISSAGTQDFAAAIQRICKHIEGE